MPNKKKLKVILLYSILILGFLPIIIAFTREINTKGQQHNKIEVNFIIDKNPMDSASYYLTDPINIDDIYPNYNWSKIESENDWCTDLVRGD